MTVAVSTLGRPRLLARCVQGVLGGDLLPSQIVIVDQSADSATADLVRERGAEWHRLVRLAYIRQHQRGLALSRNSAIAHASEPIVAFTDDDCVPDAGWLDAIVAAFDSPDSPDAVTGRILPLGPERPDFYAVASRPSVVRTVCRGLSLPWAVGSGGNTAVRRSWLHRLGGFDAGLGAGSRGMAAEDTDLLYRLLRAGATVVYEPGAVVFHERQDRQRRLASRPRYGFGMGAFCGQWARRGDAYALWMLGSWTLERARALAASLLRGRSQRVYEELMMLAGAMRGVAYGLKRPPSGPQQTRRLPAQESETAA